jgi:hypothetical protein
MVARILDLVGDEAGCTDDIPYDPTIYQRLYQHLLIHRHAQVLELGICLPTSDFTPYAFEIPIADVVPTLAEAAQAIHDVLAHQHDGKALQRTIDGWYRMA